MYTSVEAFVSIVLQLLVCQEGWLDSERQMSSLYLLDQ